MTEQEMAEWQEIEAETRRKASAEVAEAIKEAMMNANPYYRGGCV